MRRTLQLCSTATTKKRITRELHAAEVSSKQPVDTSCRLHVYDSINKMHLLVDSGSDIAIIPPGRLNHKVTNSYNCNLLLKAANKTNIKVYGTANLTLSFSPVTQYNFTFYIADVSQPILGADFLSHFHLLPDLTNKQLYDQQTGQVIHCQQITVNDQCTLSVSVTTDFESKCLTLLSQFPSLTQDTQAQLNFKHNVRHSIETKGRPVKCKPRRLNAEKLEIAKSEFRKMIEEGTIKRSSNNWASPLQMVQKPDKSWRLCSDYRLLNSLTVPDNYPVPHVEDFAVGLAGNKVFSKIDLKKAFHQIPMNADDVKKTAIITPFGLFEYLVMPFGFKNAA